MHITVIGTGFVGVVSAAVYSSFGHHVMGLDIDEKKVESLKQSRVPFYEPDLESLLAEQQKLGRLEFTTDYQVAIREADVIIIAVGTPSAPDGGADLTYVFKSCESLAPHLKPGAIIAIKSTVPPGTLPKVKAHIQQFTQTPFYMASLPEFLREGTAVHDTLHPDRVVIGATEAEAFARLEELHQPLQAPVIKVSPESAQMAKYAANAYLATRITFINQIADLCAKNGADIQQVIEAVGFDQRIGQHYWYPGFGYGGSCFPKDVKELAYYSKTVGEEGNLLIRVDELNELRIPKLMGEFGLKMSGWQGKTVAVLGLSFKPHTDDMREAPSTKVIPWLLEQGAVVRGFDPKALEVAPHFIAEHTSLSYHQTISEATQGVDVVLVLIEWPEIITFDYGSVREPSKQQWLVDARNQFSPAKAVEWGYQYLGVGR